jgi:hypothetical protein
MEGVAFQWLDTEETDPLHPALASQMTGLPILPRGSASELSRVQIKTMAGFGGNGPGTSCPLHSNSNYLTPTGCPVIEFIQTVTGSSHFRMACKCKRVLLEFSTYFIS